MAAGAYIPYSEISSVQLYALSSEDNARESFVEVQHQDLFRDGEPYVEGLYDAHLGTTDHDIKCATCQNDKKLCPGHYGSYRLNSPVLSPFFIKDITKYLRIICFSCGKIIVPELEGVSAKHRLGEYVKIARKPNKNILCVHCGSPHPHITRDSKDPTTIFMEIYEAKASGTGGLAAKPRLLVRSVLYPHLIAAIFDKVTSDTVALLGRPLSNHPRRLVWNVLRVPPNTIRPNVKIITSENSSADSNDLTIILQTIIKINDSIPADLSIDIDTGLSDQIRMLNFTVFNLIRGSNMAPGSKQVTIGKRPLMSIAKRLPRKFGRIRRNLMGRRSNHMARSFITGDPIRKINEIGLPISIAMNIQFPVYVREYNYNQCLIWFMNGTNRYPGCVKVKKGSTGTTHWVSRIKDDFRLEIGDIVYRHTIDGDIVDFNRQPSLEPSSISSMKVVIMENVETICFNVLSCNFFNADFDGDAMNVLFPRSACTRNEINMLSSPAQFFISYKDGKPKVGQVQDSVIGIANLTGAQIKFNKAHAMRMFRQVAAAGVYPNLAKYSHDHMFSGRDIISMYLTEARYFINMTAEPSFYMPEYAAYRAYDPTDIKVEIDRGVLKSGVLDKRTIGQDQGGSIYHTIYNQYGPEAALQACFDMQQIGNAMNEYMGFTMHVGDILLRDESMAKIHSVESALIADSMLITDKLNQGKIIPPIGKTVNEYYEEQQINALKPGDGFFQPIFESVDMNNNDLFRSVIYGVKGKFFNFVNTVCAIGQIEINGERMRENFGGRTLPYFTKNDPNPMSRGYVANSYASGITPAEFYFHAMDARYALINKALSTSITGMHNRMAIKSLEAIIIDNMRKATNGLHITQLLYGADGADPRFVSKVKFPTMKAELDEAAFREQFYLADKSAGKLADEEFEQLKADRALYTELVIRLERLEGSERSYSDSLPMPVNPYRIIEDTIYNLGLRKDAAKNSGKLDATSTILKVRELCGTIHYCLTNEIQAQRQAYSPIHITTACTLLRILIRSYLNVRYLQKVGVNDEALEIIIAQIRANYLRALVSYGKAMGIIASQSISEPMTQNVLDSHHNSGAGSTKKKGMFRIKEILNARPTKSMKAPSMTLQLLPQYRTNKVKVQEIANYIEQLPLDQFMTEWQIFFEKYGQPSHPAYTHEAAFIKEFEKYHIHTASTPPSDLTNWCVRIVLDKSKLIEKAMRLDTIYKAIRAAYPATHIIYSANNATSAILRIYLANSFSKKTITTDMVVDFVADLRVLVMRGIPGIKAAYVKEGKQSMLMEDGSVKSESVYYLFTDGTNLEKVLENPYIDPDTAQSDSIQEMFEIFGIASARHKIATELRHQIPDVSAKHYLIYADEMTCTGVISGISRYGSADRGSSVLLRISDANPINVIEEGASQAAKDDLTGVSPAIMMGKNPVIGDLYNTFVLDEDYVQKNVRNLDSILANL